MKATIEPLHVETQAQLHQLGERLRLARMRRRVGVDQLAAAAGLSRVTVFRIEQGKPSVAMGAYARVMEALGLAGDLGIVAQADPLGRQMQDQQLPGRRGRATAASELRAADELWAFKRHNQKRDIDAIRAGRASNAGMSWFTEEQAASAEIVGEPL
ncbi:helix-turn-helix domain-containing protein [Ramlibacter sp. AN1133]|uniref:helix-turn-helix domain-containing protein n=1 Tax=Ramlibacter sp. AN1133 TaxID=3133429 RepID=UPI0030C3F8C3